mmetsp:Transcript_16332/g.47818  ORF Transcript_16332/g.47818 Transcript_16332/m.47818 type:complete len:305 (-) Transcript_16332:1109-2023(-)
MRRNPHSIPSEAIVAAEATIIHAAVVVNGFEVEAVVLIPVVLLIKLRAIMVDVVITVIVAGGTSTAGVVSAVLMSQPIIGEVFTHAIVAYVLLVVTIIVVVIVVVALVALALAVVGAVVIVVIVVVGIVAQGHSTACRTRRNAGGSCWRWRRALLTISIAAWRDLEKYDELWVGLPRVEEQQLLVLLLRRPTLWARVDHHGVAGVRWRPLVHGGRPHVLGLPQNCPAKDDAAIHSPLPELAGIRVLERLARLLGQVETPAIEAVEAPLGVETCCSNALGHVYLGSVKCPHFVDGLIKVAPVKLL